MPADMTFDDVDLDRGMRDTKTKSKDVSLMKLEEYLKAKLQEEADLIAKLKMEWELHILHSSNFVSLSMAMHIRSSIPQFSHILYFNKKVQHVPRRYD